MLNRSERLDVLNRLEKGEITPQEAADLLSAAEPGSASLPQTPMGVLKQLERGEITPQEAARRLSTRAASKEGQENKAQKIEVIQGKPPTAHRVRGWRLVLIGSGALLAVLAGLWMSADLRDGSLGLGFFCAWIPLSLGVLLLLLGWLARRGPWANVNFRSQSAAGRARFDFDLPVPLGVAGSALNFVGDRLPALGREDLARLLQALEQAGKDGEPIEIRANSDDGEGAVDITIS